VHFFRGDVQANSDDMCRKGRQLQGETNPRSRLTAADVRSMRATFTGRYGEITALARLHNVHADTINLALRGRSWTSV